MNTRIITILLNIILLSGLLILIDITYDVSNKVSAGTSVGGIISNETWNLAGSPYWIEGNLTVSDGATLTINPGVEVRFNGYYQIEIDGSLFSIGTATNRITYTSNKSQPSSGDWLGVKISYQGHCEISYSNITYAYDAIYLSAPGNNVVSYNNISLNEYNGIYLSDSDNNDISYNILNRNGVGVYLYWSNDASITNNIISDNLVGAIFWGSRYNTLTGNDILRSSVRGILSDSNSHSNEIYHNNIIENKEQAGDAPETVNYWDNGAEGNFWSDYNGVDANEDGIGDTPYVIDEDSQDNYPLMYIYPDTSPPIIELESPANNSVVKAGTTINFSISDINLRAVEYTVNDGPSSQIDSPYEINTNTWLDGDYSIGLRASDTSGKVTSRDYYFVIDSTEPAITLNSPSNNDYIPAGTDIDLMILDNNFNTSEYSVNGGTYKNLNHPYNIFTDGWEDGIYSVQIYVNDIAGNENTKTYSFTFDSTDPTITLTTPTNDSLILAGTIIALDVSDTNLEEVTYSSDDGTYQTLDSPYNIDTFEWEDGEHTIGIVALDLAGNRKSRSYVFTTDGTSPEIAEHYPGRNSMDVPINTSITITFSEPMDTSSVESALTVSPDTEYRLSWENNDSVLRIAFTEPLEYNTYYEISVGTQARDLIGQNLENKVVISFTTQEKLKEGDDEFPIMFILLMVVLAIVAAVVIVVLVSSKKKKNASPQMQMITPTTPMPSPMTTTPVQPVTVQAPQMLQIRCSQCQNILQVKDLGMAMKVTCPFCSTALTVQSQKTATPPQQPQAQPQIMPTVQQVSCPKCKTSFPVVKSEGPKNIQCPSCGLIGKLS